MFSHLFYLGSNTQASKFTVHCDEDITPKILKRHKQFLVLLTVLYVHPLIRHIINPHRWNIYLSFIVKLTSEIFNYMKTYNWPIRCRQLKSNLQVHAFPFTGFFSEELEKRVCKQIWKMREQKGKKWANMSLSIMPF